MLACVCIGVCFCIRPKITKFIDTTESFSASAIPWRCQPHYSIWTEMVSVFFSLPRPVLRCANDVCPYRRWSGQQGLDTRQKLINNRAFRKLLARCASWSSSVLIIASWKCWPAYTNTHTKKRQIMQLASKRAERKKSARVGKKPRPNKTFTRNLPINPGDLLVQRHRALRTPACKNYSFETRLH